MTATSVRRRPRGARAQTVLLALFAISFLTAAAPYVLPLLDAEQRAWFGTYLAEALVIAATAALLLERSLCARHRAQRRFWGYWTVSMGAWLSVWALYPLARPYWETPAMNVVVELLYVVWYTGLFVAAVQIDAGPEPGIRGDLVRIQRVAVGIVLAVLVAELIVVPQQVAPESYASWLPSYVLYEILDWILVALYGWLALRSGDRHWGTVHRLLCGGLLAWALLDLLEAYLQTGPAAFEVAQSGVNVLWLAPYPLVAAAAWASARREVEGEGAPSEILLGLQQRPAAVSPLLGAFVLAATHVAVDLSGLLSEPARQARDVVILVGLVALGGVAIAYHRLEAEHRARLATEILQAQKLAAVSTLAGGLAHDLRNLATVITGNCDLVEQVLPEHGSGRAEVADIRRAAAETYDLMRRLLSLGRSREPRVERIDLNAIVLRTCSSLAPLLGGGIRLLQDLDPELPAVRGDDGRLEQVVLNLVLNARDAMPEGGILRIRTRPPSPGSAGHAARAPMVELAVSDTGVGIDPAVRERIFEPYFTTKREGKGTGLGLTTVLAIVAEHGGTIDVASVPGNGSEFRVLLPAC